MLRRRQAAMRSVLEGCSTEFVRANCPFVACKDVNSFSQFRFELLDFQKLPAGSSKSVSTTCCTHESSNSSARTFDRG